MLFTLSWKNKYISSTRRPGVRNDSIVYQGYQIPPYYDSLISKLIVFGNNRENCLLRSQRALDEFIIEPIDTSIELHKKLLRNKDIMKGGLLN